MQKTLFLSLFFFLFNSSAFAQDYDTVERTLLPKEVKEVEKQEREHNQRAVEARKNRDAALKRAMEQGA
jgi:hypothetical protein